VAATAQVEGLEAAVDWGCCPVGIAEVGVADGELAQGLDAEEGWEGEVGAEDGMVWDVIVALDQRHEWVDSDEFSGVKNRTRNAVKGELLEARDRGSDGDDESLASVIGIGLGACERCEKVGAYNGVFCSSPQLVMERSLRLWRWAKAGMMSGANDPTM
jgi:hypothetical protein